MKLWIVLVTFFLSLILWESPFLFPFKMLAVLIHELWHSFIAMFFNVDWIQFHIYSDESGKTLIKGNLPFLGFILTASAGYIGSVVTASLFLRASLKQELQDWYYLIFASLLLIVSFVFAKVGTLTFLIAFLWSIVLIILYFLNKKLAFSLFIAIQSFILFYSFYDLLDFSKKPFESDIGILYNFLKSKNISLGEEKSFVYTIASIWISLIIYIFYKLVIHSIFEEATESIPEDSTPNETIMDITNSPTEPQEIPLPKDLPTDEEINKLINNS